jgi:hypothetical protein
VLLVQQVQKHDADSFFWRSRKMVSAFVLVMLTAAFIGLTLAVVALSSQRDDLAKINDGLRDQVEDQNVELACRAQAVSEVDAALINELAAIGDSTQLILRGLVAVGERRVEDLEALIGRAQEIDAVYGSTRLALQKAQDARELAIITCSRQVEGG